MILPDSEERAERGILPNSEERVEKGDLSSQ